MSELRESSSMRRRPWARREQVTILQVLVSLLAFSTVVEGVVLLRLSEQVRSLEAPSRPQVRPTGRRQDGVIENSEADELLTNEIVDQISEGNVTWLERYFDEAELAPDEANLVRGVVMGHILEVEKIEGRLSSGNLGLEEAVRMKNVERTRVQRVLVRVLGEGRSAALMEVMTSVGY